MTVLLAISICLALCYGLHRIRTREIRRARDMAVEQNKTLGHAAEASTRLRRENEDLRASLYARDRSVDKLQASLRERDKTLVNLRGIATRMRDFNLSGKAPLPAPAEQPRQLSIRATAPLNGGVEAMMSTAGLSRGNGSPAFSK